MTPSEPQTSWATQKLPTTCTRPPLLSAELPAVEEPLLLAVEAVELPALVVVNARGSLAPEAHPTARLPALAAAEV